MTGRYAVRAELVVHGIVAEHDIVGAVYGETEGIIAGADFRTLQKSGRVGRLEIELEPPERGSAVTRGTLQFETSLGLEETVLVAALLGEVERVGPCRAELTITTVADLLAEKRGSVVGRAVDILRSALVGNDEGSADQPGGGPSPLRRGRRPSTDQ